MTWQDFINGAFELLGGVMIFGNVLATYRAKKVTGVSLIGTIFFSSWGYWNLYYYPHLNQWASFVGGVLIVLGNTSWISLWLYYLHVERERRLRIERAIEMYNEETDSVEGRLRPPSTSDYEAFIAKAREAGCP